jgi:hypothetical protein
VFADNNLRPSQIMKKEKPSQTRKLELQFQEINIVILISIELMHTPLHDAFGHCHVICLFMREYRFNKLIMGIKLIVQLDTNKATFIQYIILLT